MAEKLDMSEVVSEIKNANEDELKSVIENWFETTRTSGMKIGARYMSAGIFGVIQKHLKKSSKPSLRDYQRCIDEIIQIISVQLADWNDSMEENKDDRTAE